MPTEKEITENLKKCPRFNDCSISLCPLDLKLDQRVYKNGESRCPFTIKKKSKSQKGLRTRMLDRVLKFIPKSNIKMLHRRNQKRWHELRKNYGRK